MSDVSKNIIMLVIGVFTVLAIKFHYSSSLLKNGKVTVAEIIDKKSTKSVHYKFIVNNKVYYGTRGSYSQIREGKYLLYYDSTKFSRNVLIEEVRVDGYKLGDELDTIYPMSSALLNRYN